MKEKVVLASNNAGKLREFSASLGQAGIEIVPQGELGIAEADEPFATFVENALTKARHASRISGMPALADDSGLCVYALNGEPGVLSARYAALAGGEKSDRANNERLMMQLKGRADRRACYIALLVFVQRADDPTPIIAEGRWEGEITDTPRGLHGFGYDPYFYLPTLGKTAAELDISEKNAISHRARALKRLLASLSERPA